MKKRLLVTALSLSITLIGCHKTEQAVTKQGQAESPTPQPTAEAKPITLNTKDGWKIVGDLYGTSNNPKGIVILLHQRGGSAHDWVSLCTQLQAEGLSALALDLRGTGRSNAMSDGKEAPWSVGKDIDAARAILKGPIGLVGASYGANNALIYAAENPKAVQAVALFSPGRDYHGLQAIPAAKKYHGAVRIWNQINDIISGEGPREIASAGKHSGYELHEMSGADHGTALLNSETITETVSFFKAHLK